MTFTSQITIENTYSINNNALPKRDYCRDLAVIFGSDFKFRIDYEDTVNKAYRLLGFVIRNTKNFQNVNIIVRLYNTFLRSLLEVDLQYSVFQLSPTKNFKKVQKQFLKFLYFVKFNVYPIYSLLVFFKSLLDLFGIQSLLDSVFFVK